MTSPLSNVLLELDAEVRRARAKHPAMNSPHEGISVIKEEVDELLDHVKADTGQTLEARDEAIQIAAMGIRYVLDLIDVKPMWEAQILELDDAEREAVEALR